MTTGRGLYNRAKDRYLLIKIRVEKKLMFC